MLTPRKSLLRISLVILLILNLNACNSLSSKTNDENVSQNSIETSVKISTSRDALSIDRDDSDEANNKIDNNKASIKSDTAVAQINAALNSALVKPNTTQAVGDLWNRVRQGFEFSDIHVDNKEAQKRIEYHRQRLLRTPTLIQRVTDNAGPYFYYIISQLEQNNLPLEIAILPIIESHYDAFAYSPGRASGLWQFIPGTGKRFGLAQDWWHDERRDTIAATGAAIQYLLYLHNMFDGDWLLAMASYNAGQGRVLKAVKKNRRLGLPTDYWSLDLPKETRHYIPKLLAWRDIIKKHNHYNVKFAPIADKPIFEIVDIGSQIDLAQVAELAEIDIDLLYELNPAYNRWATDPSPPHDLLIPINQVSILKRKLDKLPAQQRMSWKRYVIQKNDTLGKIANDFDSDINLIVKINGIKNNRIRAGKALMIPAASKKNSFYTKSIEQRLSKRQNQAPRKNAKKITHKVKPGDSLWNISQRYNVRLNSLARWNQMSPRDTLSINKSLTVWIQNKNFNAKKISSTSKNETRKLFYKVKKGDSLDLISNRFNVSIGDIKQWNSSARNKYIKPGQLLTLYVALTDRELSIN